MNTNVTPVPEYWPSNATDSCSGRFCGRHGSSTKLQIVCQAGSIGKIVGWCDVCHRYVCDECAFRRRLPPAEGKDLVLLACRYCGLALGRTDECLLVPPEVPSMSDGGEAADSITDVQAQRVDWAGFYRYLIGAGLITTSGLRRIEAAIAAGRQEEALSLLEIEEDACEAAGYEAGLAHCALQKGLTLIMLNRPEEARDCLEAAEPFWRRAGTRRKLSQLLFGKYHASQWDELPLTERLRQLDELEKTVAGVNQPMTRFCVEERTRLRKRSRLASTPHPDADPDSASRRNIQHQQELKQYQRDLASWKALSLWKRFAHKKPEPPNGNGNSA